MIEYRGYKYEEKNGTYTVYDPYGEELDDFECAEDCRTFIDMEIDGSSI